MPSGEEELTIWLTTLETSKHASINSPMIVFHSDKNSDFFILD
jgi:hypothetical protein